MISKIKNAAIALQEELIAIRRHIHSHPELSFEEFNTSRFIKSKLDQHGINYTDGYVKTGIVAYIQGDIPGPIKALRAELDALPIVEKNNVDYKSTVEGKMHACGHDVHATCALGAAIILQQLKSELVGSVYIIFQPGEELLPGGASLMLKENIFPHGVPSAIYALHVFNELEYGNVGLCGGKYMASADEIYVTIKGKGGHAALPQNNTDTVLVTAQVIIALQSIVSRNANPFIPSVLSIGKINSEGGATNIIPNEIKLEGTFRTMDENWRLSAHKQIENIIQNTCNAYGASAEINIVNGYPCLHNDIEVTTKSKARLVEVLGDAHVHDISQRMTSEDFSFFAEKIPACFFRLGIANKERGITSGVHTSTFDVDERCIHTGVISLAALVIE
jgi:amidohydrolase